MTYREYTAERIRKAFRVSSELIFKEWRNDYRTCRKSTAHEYIAQIQIILLRNL